MVFVVADVIQVLTDTPNPGDYIKKMPKRDDGLSKGWGQFVTPLYKPRNGQGKRYEAVVLEYGSLELLGQQFSSPSYAALAGIQDAGSDRKTVNGWTSWKNSQNRTLADLREQLLNTTVRQ